MLFCSLLSLSCQIKTQLLKNTELHLSLKYSELLLHVTELGIKNEKYDNF